MFPLEISLSSDRIPAQLFKILKDDAVKVLHSICQQIWKTQQWPQNWKMSVFIPIPKKGRAKECSNYHAIVLISHARRGFPDSSVGKESVCNVGDTGLIPRSGISAGEGTGYPLQYSWASLVAQLLKNLPAMRETWVRSLGWENPLEKGKATHSSITA